MKTFRKDLSASLLGLLAISVQSNATAQETVVTVTTISEDRALQEFMDVCFDPDFSLDEIDSAISKSSFEYRETQRSVDSVDWLSSESSVSLRLFPGMSQCAMIMGTESPFKRTGLLIKIYTLIARRMDLPVRIDAAEEFLEWRPPESGDLKRITLMGGGEGETQTLDLVFDRTTVAVREQLDALVREKSAKRK